MNHDSVPAVPLASDDARLDDPQPRPRRRPLRHALDRHQHRRVVARLQQRQHLHLREVVEPERQRLEQVADGLDVERPQAPRCCSGPAAPRRRRPDRAPSAGAAGPRRGRRRRVARPDCVRRVQDGGDRCVQRRERAGVDPVAPGELAVGERDRAALQPLAGLAGEADADHGVVGAVLDHQFQARAVEVELEPLHDRHEARQGQQRARRGPPGLQPERVRHHAALREPAEHDRGRPGSRAAPADASYQSVSISNAGQNVSGSGKPTR